MLSTFLMILFESISTKALDEVDFGKIVNRTEICYLRFADDTMIFDAVKTQLQMHKNIVTESFHKYGLRLILRWIYIIIIIPNITNRSIAWLAKVSQLSAKKCSIKHGG